MAAKRLTIVHGVQTGTNEDAVKGPKVLEQLVNTIAAGRIEVKTDHPAYEDINDESVRKFKLASKLIVDGLTGGILGSQAAALVDLVGDVIIYKFTERAKAIRKHVRGLIEADQCSVLAGHSLGSVVCFDVLCEMIAEGKFKGPKNTWPVQYFVTFGSPLSLRMFANHRALEQLEEGKTLFWYNYYDRSDPVPAGSLFGVPRAEFETIRSNLKDEDVESWHIYDNIVDTGFSLLSHINYWGNASIGTRIASLLGRNN